MKPSKERSLAAEFERIVVERSVFGASTLRISRLLPHHANPTELIQRFEKALSKQSAYGSFQLSEIEFDAALELLISQEATLQELQAHILLSKLVKIEEWRIAGAAVSASSMITWTFGTSPRIATFLRFNDRAEFAFVSMAFEELKICRLSEKHLKPMKTGKWTGSAAD